MMWNSEISMYFEDLLRPSHYSTKASVRLVPQGQWILFSLPYVQSFWTSEKNIYTKGAQCTFPKRVQTKVFTIRMDKQWCSIHVEVFKQVSSILLFVLVVASTPPIMSLFFFFYLFFKKIPNTENLSIQFIRLNKVKVLINIPTEN